MLPNASVTSAVKQLLTLRVMFGFLVPTTNCGLRRRAIRLESSTYVIGSVTVSNFLTPAFFDELAPAKSKFDH